MAYGTKIEYRGCILKSKIEHAWARFFDLHGYAWEYEPVKFRGRAVGVYTPDFRLPDLGIFVEIKPFDNIKVNQWHLCTERLLVVFGAPDRCVIRFKPPGTLGAFEESCFESWDTAIARAISL